MPRGRDPYWLRAKFTSKCVKCSQPIKKDDEAFYYPNNKRIYCESEACGKQAYRDFESARFDEGGM